MRLHPRAFKIGLSCVAVLACALLAVTSSPAQVEGFECLDSDWASKVPEPEYAEKPNIASAVVRLRIYVVRDDYGQGVQ